jgi:hypothetical protein
VQHRQAVLAAHQHLRATAAAAAAAMHRQTQAAAQPALSLLQAVCLHTWQQGQRQQQPQQQQMRAASLPAQARQALASQHVLHHPAAPVGCHRCHASSPQPALRVALQWRLRTRQQAPRPPQQRSPSSRAPHPTRRLNRGTAALARPAAPRL